MQHPPSTGTTFGRMRWAIPTIVLALVLSACGDDAPPDEPSPTTDATAETPTAPTEAATPSPSPTPVPDVEVPLAVVTGYTNPTASITLDALATANPIVPCEVSELSFVREGDGECVPLEDVVDRVQAEPTRIALLPPSHVVPQVKVLPVDGADLFGGPSARALDYPVTGRGDALQPHDPDEIRTLISLGDSCPDRGVAHAAITLGRGWEWVFGGGTAEYVAVYPNPVAPGQVGHGFNVVDAVPTGNEGAVADLVSGADITVNDFECPVVDNWRVNEGVIFTIDPRVLDHLRDDYGVDVATLAANHLFDAGTAGFLETLDKFDGAGIERTGAGRDLDEALEPAVTDVTGLRFGFVGFNEIPGSLAAGPGQPGVAWLTEENVREAVGRARAAADVVICLPQWWGGAEYHATWYPSLRAQQTTFFDAGCDQVLGHGTHWSGPIDFTPLADGGTGFTILSHGNFLFGQSWSQQTQEGVIVELAFRGTELAQARMHPYIMLEQAQTNLVDPESDGMWVLNRIYEASDLPIVGGP
jgi:hypothetical protein